MFKMKVLIFMASPHKNGYTMKLCNSFIEGIGTSASIEMVFPYDEKIEACSDCKCCQYEKMKCSIEDSMTDICRKIDEADIIILASPMYFCSFPGPMKNIIDRTQIFWSSKYIFKDKPVAAGKTGILIAAAGIEWEDMFTSMECTAKYFYKCIGAELKQVVYLNNTDKLTEDQFQHALNKCYETGVRFSQNH